MRETEKPVLRKVTEGDQWMAVEFVCPHCVELVSMCEGDFTDSNWTEWTCEHCGGELKVERPEFMGF